MRSSQRVLFCWQAQLQAVETGDADIAYGITGNILIGSYSEPIGVSLWRSGLRLLQKLEQN